MKEKKSDQVLAYLYYLVILTNIVLILTFIGIHKPTEPMNLLEIVRYAPLGLFLYLGIPAQAQVTPLAKTNDLILKDVTVKLDKRLDLLVFEQTVQGTAGGTTPAPAGQMDGAPVLGYVFPTTLAPADVGFIDAEGIVALAVTSHPDFDDTPLWDENRNKDYNDDGVVYHTHWVVLGSDDRVPGGLSVVEIRKEDAAEVLPPTAPGMPMYLDSPGFPVGLNKHKLSVVIPRSRVNNRLDFNYDAVTVYMEVNTSDKRRPLLGVYAVYSVLSGDLSLPYAVKR